MLICPRCQFKNPDENKFCQHCGHSLTIQDSLSVEAEVDVSEQSEQFGADVAERLLAVLQSPNDQWAWEGQDDPELRSRLEKMGATLQSVASLYQRYSVVVDPAPIPLAMNAQGFVHDSQPDQERFLDQLLALETDAEQSPSPLGADPVSPEIGLPGIVGPYFSLDEVLGTRLPEVYDCWEDGDKEVLLLEDRSGWMSLSELWQQEEETPLLEVLFGLRDSLELWETLQPFHGCRSLLFPDNLRVDEDRVLVFQRLYCLPEPEDPPLLKDLGQVWLQLLESVV